jgi:hypothetical protein
MSKPLSLEKYTDTKTFYVGRRLKTDPTQKTFVVPASSYGGYGGRHTTGADAVANGWKGNPAAVSPWNVTLDGALPMGAWGIVIAVIDDAHVDAMFLWKTSRGIVAATVIHLHCSNFVTSRGGPPMAGEDESLKAGRTAPAAAPAAPAAAPAVASDADATLDAIRKALGVTAAPAIDEDMMRRAVKEQLDPFREAMQPVMDVLASLRSDPLAKAKIVTAVAASKNPVVDLLSQYYTVGHDAVANVCLAAPPSIGKTFAYRQLGKAYDMYLEHGCTADSEEINTMLGSTAPDGKGGFVVFDGVLTQAVRTASTGQNVLLLLDEVLRLSEQGQVWLLSFLTGVETADGKKYRLRTRRVTADGTLEVIECAAKHLHIGAAVNLGARTPNDAFWSRWDHQRLAFDEATVKGTARSFADNFGVTDAGELAEKFTAALIASRAGVADGSLKYSLDFRALQNALSMVTRRTGSPSAADVCTAIAAGVEARCAHWGIDSGETDPASATSVALVKLALGVR